MSLPLHTGHAPAYLVRRMIRLSHAMSKVIIDEYGQMEFLRRLSDPLWFQAFGCVLSFDWHSSGVTTVVSGVLKQALKQDVHGISMAGGKGKKSTSAKKDIPLLAENSSLSSAKVDSLLYASRMAAKVDSAALQDGYSLCHHVILFDERGNWAVVQQGMNTESRIARRYHWLSGDIPNFARESRAGTIRDKKNPRALDMTAVQSQENQKGCVDLAKSDTNNLKSSVYRLVAKDTLDRWLGGGMIDTFGYEMPRRLDWDLFKRIHDIQPRNYEELLSIQGVGGSTVRALSLVAELIHGAKASWNDPVKYSFAHGGKDGVPYPVARRVYDESIRNLHGAIEGAEIEREERTGALKKLEVFQRECSLGSEIKIPPASKMWRMAKVLVGKASEIGEGKMTHVTAGGKEILVANVGGSYYATGNICTHAGAELHEGELNGKELTCPWHGSKWDITTGSMTWFPQKLKDIGKYKVTVENDTVYVEV